MGLENIIIMFCISGESVKILIWILLSFFAAGVLLAFTACMYPMIPILSSVIVGHGKSVTAGSAFVLSLVYVEAVAVTYAVIGLISAQIGAGGADSPELHPRVPRALAQPAPDQGQGPQRGVGRQQQRIHLL